MTRKQMAGTGEQVTEPARDNPICGLVMPISEIDSMGPQHWSDVRDILTETLTNAGFEPRLVSDGNAANIIQRRIVRNLYSDPVVLCDVSGRNPNVMFELGLRLAFDKPTVVIKDDATPYSFDTAPFEHLSYPRSLRYLDMIAFREQLSEKVRATFEEGKKAEYSPFLRTFGDISAGDLERHGASFFEAIMERMDDMQSAISRLSRPRSGFIGKGLLDPVSPRLTGATLLGSTSETFEFSASPEKMVEVIAAVRQLSGVLDVVGKQLNDQRVRIAVQFTADDEAHFRGAVSNIIDNVVLNG